VSKLKTEHVLGGTLLLVAAGIAMLATKSAGPVQLTKYVELHAGPLQEHLVTVDELNMSRTFTQPHWPLHYPGQVAAGVSQAVNLGFAPLWQLPDPQAAALPMEKAV
jgi:hypothetical protein